MDGSGLLQLMARSMDEATPYVTAGGKAMDQVKTKQRWVMNELRRRANEVKGVADRFKREAVDLDEVLAFCAAKFEEALRILSGALGMAASGVERGDTNLLRMATAARQQGVEQARAAYQTID